MQSVINRSLGERSRREKIGTIALLFALLACTVLAIGSFANRAEAAGTCTIPTDSIGVKTTDTSHPDAAQAWDNMRVEVSVSNLDGVAAGCTATVQLPSVFTGMAAKTTYLNADGTSSSTKQADTVMVMQTNPDGQMVFTTTDYTATHEGVSAVGWANAQITDAITSGKPQPLDYKVNGVVKEQQLPVATCDASCSALPTDASKWGQANQDGSGTVTVQTPAADQTGTAVHVTDTLTSAGQEITGVAWVWGYNCVTSWNSPGTLGDDGQCVAGNTIPVQYTQNGQAVDFTSSVDHEFFRVGLKMQFTGDGPWTDTATATLNGVPSKATTTVNSYQSGGSGTGHDKSTPSTTPTSPVTSPTSPVTTPTSPATTPTSPVTTPTSPVTSPSSTTPTSPVTTPTSPATTSPATTPTSPVTTPSSSTSPATTTTSTTPSSPATTTPTSPVTTPTSPATSKSSTTSTPCTSMSTPATSSSTSTPATHPGMPSCGDGTPGHGAGTPMSSKGPKVQTDKLGGGLPMQLELAVAGMAASGLGLVSVRLRRSRR